MIVFDAHAHVHGEEESVLRQKCGIRTMISAGTPEQCRIAFDTAEKYPVHTVTAGLHPWYAAQYSVEDVHIYMEKTPVIGEIGMDSVWCNVPLETQKRVFIRQLDIAREMKKPVVLHTKGCEREIAEIIEKYDLTFIVHWYSGGREELAPYLDMDCFFTIGPSVGFDPNVSCVAGIVPENRILFETDGMEAVSWAVGETPVSALPEVLENSVLAVSEIRRVSPQQLLKCANSNFFGLIKS